ncbi:hypothetical protein H6G81_22280 [Scytonema hofmannii FACHB-248]|uniref:DUF4351 domain-containing protein n=1 Tax=Scytonema hofmannii FACHB-248 TaxID=1842502 RepID=A0ABR8GVU2_9CYAN|nr:MULTISPECIES: hypothetical protein [Nostocales]MBD2607179.1 hypothetical protein [Scytonema hofmannii FACHB-248]
MQEISNYTQELFNRISPIVKKLFTNSNFYIDRLNEQEMVEMLVNLFGKFSPEEMKAISDNELSSRIKKILTLEAVSGTLNDLTPEQIKIFDEAVLGK